MNAHFYFIALRAGRLAVGLEGGWLVNSLKLSSASQRAAEAVPTQARPQGHSIWSPQALLAEPTAPSGEVRCLSATIGQMDAEQVTPMAVGLFAKAPRPGHVKTRLHPPLTPDEAAALHWAFSADTWERLQLLPGVTPYFYTDELWDVSRRLPGDPAARLQRGDDLGARMFHCLEHLHRAGHQLIMIIGSDSPSLPLDYLLQGFQMLCECDAVLGPAGDGGFYAVGCRSPRAGMFRGVSWSTPNALDETLAAFGRVGLLTQLMPSWYDIDSLPDLQRLACEAHLPWHTQAWIDAHAARIAPAKSLLSQTASSRKS